MERNFSRIKLGRFYLCVIVMTLVMCFSMMGYVDINASLNAFKRIDFNGFPTYVDNLMKRLSMPKPIFP